MIQQKHIKDQYKNRLIEAKKIQFWRDAADGKLDAEKWRVLGAGRDAKTKSIYGPEHPYLLRFEYETDRSYIERLQLANDYALSKIVVDSYTELFRRAAKRIEIIGFSDELTEQFINNIDNQGSTWEVFMAEAFEDLLKVGLDYAATDSDEVRPGVVMPYSYLIPREQIRNKAGGAGAFKFVTWDSIREEVEGIKITEKPVIHIFTDEELAVAEKTRGHYRIVETVEHDFGRAPVRDAWFGSEAIPIIDPVAKLQFNLMNLDSEQRKIMRNQAGINLLETYEGVDLTQITDTTHIPLPKGADIPRSQWVTWPSASMDAHFKYKQELLDHAAYLSRVRLQKKGAETAESKTLDFTQTEAVYNAALDALVPFMEQIAQDWGLFAGVEPVVSIDIQRDLDFTPLSEKMDGLLKLLSVEWGETFETHIKQSFRDKNFKLSDEEREQSDAELARLNQFDTFSTGGLDG